MSRSSHSSFRRSIRYLRALLVGITALLVLVVSPVVGAAPSDHAAVRDKILSGESEDAVAAIQAIAAWNDEQARVLLGAWLDKELRVDSSDTIFITKTPSTSEDAIAAFPGLGARSPSLPWTKTISANNTLRRQLQSALARLRLSADDVEVRLAAAKELSAHPKVDDLVLLHARVDVEEDEDVLDFLHISIAKVELEDADPDVRIKAVKRLHDAGDIAMVETLRQRSTAQPDGTYPEPDAKVRGAIAKALTSIDRRIFVFNFAANALYGLSLASVLLLAALGLAITFGLMGVINMAHGEMLMIGAYATYFAQGLFTSYAPELADWYLALAVPLAFVSAGAVGVFLEQTVIRRLYGRPLETLLATWGLSLILIQVVRMMFGAQNVSVGNPSWLSGGWDLLPNVVVPYSRIAVLLFTAVVVTFVWLVLQRTSLGLRVRAVTQNRGMAAGIGIATQRVDMWTFALGSGVAGLGGVALSQLGNVGPELGQQHIIDSFIVVVLGGVGNIAGTVLGSLCFGMANKFLEPVTGAVLGKILILGLLILFIQRRPQGLFALKGRSVEN